MPLDKVISRLLCAYAVVAPTERGGYALAKTARAAIPQSRWAGIFNVRGVGRLQLDLGTYPDCCMAFGLYESDTVRVLRRLLGPGKWFVDGGANLGYFTLLASRLVGASGRVDAFEPDPTNGARLQAHIKNNAADNVMIHATALSDRAGKIEMTHPTARDSNHGMATAFSTLAAAGERYTVATVRMDHQLASGVPDVVKLDVEGAELAAIRGMRAILSNARPPALIVEHNHVTSLAAGYTSAELFQEIINIQPKYRFYWIGWRLWPIRSPEELEKIKRQGNLLIQAEQ